MIVCGEPMKIYEIVWICNNIPFIIHFELPEEKETLIKSGLPITVLETEDETLAITFTTDRGTYPGEKD